MITNRLFQVALFASSLPLLACSKPEVTKATEESAIASAAPQAPKTLAIIGAGATFPFPLYSKWMSDYNQLHPNVQINYQSIGSGGGIRQITAGTVDFGATDAPMTQEEQSKAPRKLIHIPTALGAVVLTYNLEGISESLKLTPNALSEIYLGKIKKWNDPKIAKDNPLAKLPSKDISVVYRSDGSGTTAVFTDYLAKVSPEFKDRVGVGKSVKWPTGLGAKGNEGVTGQVKTTPNAIGYVELVYATQNKMPIASVANAAGKFIVPSIAATTAAASGVELSPELHASVTNAAGDEAYPISSYTYLLVYEDLVDPVKGPALADFVWWATHDGQRACEPLGYAPLPQKTVLLVEAKLKALHVAGKPALTIK